MEWPRSSAVDDEAANPWSIPAQQEPPAVPQSTSKARKVASEPTAARRKQRNPPLANPLYPGSPVTESSAHSNQAARAFVDEHPQIEATRPSLQRLTSRSLYGLLHGLDSLSFPNASSESLSTENGGPNGARRSLDELRRLSIKGKARAIDVTGLEYDSLGSSSLASSAPGREALLHVVQKGDSLPAIALLYGCTVQSIRTANKLWLNDPIYLRKSLYIPLDSCVQPPSKEVEFVHKPQEDVIHLFLRGSEKGSSPPGQSWPSGDPAQRTRSASIRQEAMYERGFLPYRDPEPGSRAESPISSQRSSFSHSRQASTSSSTPYRPSTGSDFAGSDDGLAPSAMAGFDSDRPSAPHRGLESGIDLATRPAQSTVVKVLQIVSIPGVKPSIGSNTSGIAKGKSPLVNIDNSPDVSIDHQQDTLWPGEVALAVTATSTSMTPSSSNDHLKLPNSVPAQLRLRPKSPLDDLPSDAAAPQEDPSSKNSLAVMPPRRRKISKEAVPRAAKTDQSQQSPVLPKSINNVLSIGAGLVSNLLGGSGGSSRELDSNRKWLDMGGFEEEMQLARDYQTRQTHQRSASMGSQRVQARARSSMSLRADAAAQDAHKSSPRPSPGELYFSKPP